MKITKLIPQVEKESEISRLVIDFKNRSIRIYDAAEGFVDDETITSLETLSEKMTAKEFKAFNLTLRTVIASCLSMTITDVPEELFEAKL